MFPNTTNAISMKPVEIQDAPCVKGRNYFKPFKYPWAFELAMKHEKIHWVPTEVSLGNDVSDWNANLTADEKNLLTQLFRFFTQADVDVLQGYAGKFLPTFYRTPELAAALSSIAAREMVHVWGYSYLLETVGMPETEYKAFLSYAEMAEKEEFVLSFDCDTPENVAKTLAVYGAFTEGLQLFSSFAILMNFPRFRKMQGMGKIIEWSIRDENLHVEVITNLYKTWLEENPQIDRVKLEAEIYDICQKMVELEDHFIDLAFGVGKIEGLTKEEVKQYIRNIADKRLAQLNMAPIYNVPNPLEDWLDLLLYGAKKTNFFENRETKYSRGAIQFDEENTEW